MVLKKVLAFSSSRTANSGFLDTVIPVLTNFLGEKEIDIAFIPFASVVKDYEAYADMVAIAFKGFLYRIKLVQPANAVEVIKNAGAIMTGGGNTFKLLHDIYEYKLLDLIRDRVDAGIPYIGWSAGANITSPTIGTTNDMPIIEPKSFNSLGLFPFQLNPHYFNQSIEGYNGETRDQRLTEYALMNPGVPIIGLPEGTYLRLENNALVFEGSDSGICFTTNNETGACEHKEIHPGEQLSYLL